MSAVTKTASIVNNNTSRLTCAVNSVLMYGKPDKCGFRPVFIPKSATFFLMSSTIAMRPLVLSLD